MKSNEDLQRNVEDAIQWEPLLSAARIGVSAKDGIVTLSGTVDRLSKKTEAEEAAKKVSGVKIVVENIEVQNTNWQQKNDNEIASEVLNALKWNWNTDKENIRVKVESGWVTLSGEVEWNNQKDAAKAAVVNLIGVKGVINNIALSSESDITVSHLVIEHAIKSHIEMNRTDVAVIVKGRDITLTGTVDTWYQKELAGRIAWKAPGALNVENLLKVAYELNEKEL